MGVAYADIVQRRFQVCQFVDSPNLVSMESVAVQLRAKECLLISTVETDLKSATLKQLLERSGITVTERKKCMLSVWLSLIHWDLGFSLLFCAAQVWTCNLNCNDCSSFGASWKTLISLTAIVLAYTVWQVQVNDSELSVWLLCHHCCSNNVTAVILQLSLITRISFKI